MHQHTQAIWEKEIRRQRKEYFKAHSVGVKHAEELKLAKESLKTAESSLVKEKERSRAREQEAFKARYQIVGVQEQLEQALERVKVVEQERDAFKTLAKNEEVARIAAEGCIPLPPADDADDEFASPKKKPRASLSVVDIVSSAASEQEIEDLSLQLEWEKKRADRAQEHVDFLLAECELRSCPCARSNRRTTLLSPRRMRPQNIEILDAADLAILSKRAADAEMAIPELEAQARAPIQEEEQEAVVALEPKPKPKEKRRSTIFCPKEGIFRTISQEEAEALEKVEEDTYTEPPTPVEPRPDHPKYARTPSVDPPSFALLAQERTSLLSLLNAPHEDMHDDYTDDLPSIPTMSDMSNEDNARCIVYEDENATPRAQMQIDTTDASRPHTSAAFYTVTTTTTVPLRDDKIPDESDFQNRVRSQSRGSQSSFDASNPALTPTMTREQALAQIRERRGRARSAAQGAATPRRQMVKGVERRDMSAPMARLANKSRS